MPAPQSGYVLLVEDNAGDRMLFGEALDHTGCDIGLRLAANAEEALRMIREGDPAAGLPRLIVLDLHMPGKDGKAMLAELAALPQSAGVPVMMLTSSSRPRDQEECLALGACGFRVKPNDWSGYQELIGFLQPFWERAHRAGAP
jgi:two-component system response regulator